MARLIDVDSAVKAISRLAEDMSINDRAVALLLALELNNEDRFPAADVVPVVHGHWIWDDEENSYYCDICNRHVYGETAEVLSGDYQYCPYCGAMDEVTE